MDMKKETREQVMNIMLLHYKQQGQFVDNNV